MSLISGLLQEVSKEEKRTGESQCFIGHEFRHKDLRVKLERALERLGLQAYFADKEVTGEFVLTKVCKKILVTRASIVDLTTANPNVYFELGVAIGLNKPVFVVLKRGASVPPLLENFVKLRFTHYAALERELVEQVPGWLEQSIEHHLLYNNHCHFVNVLCPDRRRITPRRCYLVIDQIESTDETGQPTLAHDPDLRAELPAALDRFHFDPVFLGDVPLQDTFRLCDYCRTLRDSSFALCHLSRRTSPNVYLLLGLVTGLNIPSLLMVHEERDKEGHPLFEIPTMLRGLDAFYYEHSVDIGERLGDEVEGFLNRQKSKPDTSRILAFPNLTRRLPSERLMESELELTAASSAELLDELISSGLDLDKLLLLVLEEIISVVRGPESDATVSGDILLLDESEQKLVLVASRGSSLVRSEVHFAMGEGVCGWSALYNQPVLVHDVREEIRYIAIRPDILSKLVVPMINVDGQLVGVINLESPQVAYFTEGRVRSVESLAALAASGLRNALHAEEVSTQRQLDRAILSSALNLEEVLQTILDSSLRLIGVRYGNLMLVEGDDLVIRATTEPQEEEIGFRLKIDNSVSGLPVIRKEAVIIPDVDQEPLYTRVLKEQYMRSELAVPLIENDRVIGVLNVESPRLNAFTEHHIELLETLAGQAAIAIRNAKQRTREVTVRETLSRIQSIVDPSQQAEALIALLDDLIQLQDTEGVRRVIEIALAMEAPEKQSQVLFAASRAYEMLGDRDKASEVVRLVTTYPKGKAVFVSYSHNDRSFAQRLAEDLQAAGVDIWIDAWEIKGGDSIARRIEEGVRDAAYFIVVLSPSSVQSKWVKEELNAALLRQLEDRSVRILPVLYQDCEVPPVIRSIRYADFRSNYSLGLQDLLSAIRQDRGARGRR